MEIRSFPAGGGDALARSATLDQRFALDMQGMDTLRRTAQQAPQEALRQVSRQFEALFMGMLLKSMRDATPVSDVYERRTEQFYQSMFDQQIAQSMSGRSIGLADALFAQLGRHIAAGPVPADGTGTATASPASRELATALPQRQTLPTAAAPAWPAASASASASAYAAAAAVPQPPATARRTAASNADQPAHVDQFVKRLGAAADRASQSSGLSAPLILAQAALESGWGRREIRGDDGAQSFNLFGIKADRSWKGAVVETMTTEYVDGVPQRGRARFRAYASYEEAFADYARFLTGNPRYRQVLATRDPVQAAHGLQRAGYATDPGYGGKLERILRQIT